MIECFAKFCRQVVLKYDGNFICGGSVIGPRHVLTASHCTRNRDAAKFTVLLGRLDLSAVNEPGAQGTNLANLQFCVFS